MRPQTLRAVLYVSAALLSPAAMHADPTDTFTLSGDAYTISFALPASFNVGGTLQVVNPRFTTEMTYMGQTYVDDVTFLDPYTFQFDTFTNAAGFDVSTPLVSSVGDTYTFNTGMYSALAYVNCVSRLTIPQSRAMPTLAWFQLPTLPTSCGSSFSLNIAPTTTATPEPASALLLGTGALGLICIGSRRLWS